MCSSDLLPGGSESREAFNRQSSLVFRACNFPAPLYLCLGAAPPRGFTLVHGAPSMMIVGSSVRSVTDGAELAVGEAPGALAAPAVDAPGSLSVRPSVPWISVIGNYAENELAQRAFANSLRLGEPRADALGRALVCYQRGRDQAAWFPRSRNLGVPARRHHLAIAIQLAEEKLLRHAGVPDVPLDFSYREYRADGEDGVPVGHRLCRSCLVCRPEDEYHDPVMCDKAVMLNFSVALAAVKLYHTKGFLTRVRRFEQLHGSSNQPVTRDGQVMQSLALLGRCPSRIVAARRHASDRDSINVAVCPIVTQSGLSDGVLDQAVVLHPFSSGSDFVETSVAPVTINVEDDAA